MKKIFEQHSKYEQVFRNKDFSELVEEVKSFKNISNKNTCQSTGVCAIHPSVEALYQI